MTINPTWQTYNPVTTALTYNTLFPTTALTSQVPYSTYPLMWVLPRSGSVMVRLPCRGPVAPLRSGHGMHACIAGCVQAVL